MAFFKKSNVGPVERFYLKSLSWLSYRLTVDGHSLNWKYLTLSDDLSSLGNRLGQPD